MIRLINNTNKFLSKHAPTSLFSTKPPKQTHIIKVSKKKLNEALNGQLIYSTNKNKQFFIMSSIMTLGMAFSVYSFQQYPGFYNLLPLLVMASAFAIHQKRLFNTIHQITISKTGQKISVSNYGLFGTEIFSKTTNIPIHIMSGIARKRFNRGIVIHGGGKFGIKAFSYYFHQAGILDRYVFHQVVSGKQVRYTDQI